MRDLIALCASGVRWGVCADFKVLLSCHRMLR